MKVFFYGLFMDEKLLAARGIEPADVKPGFVDGRRLHIGRRATLVRRRGGRVYGVMMEIDPGDVKELYADESVAAYLPESVIVELMDGTRHEATCYNLPGDKATGTNKAYAEALLDVATDLGFPDSYLDEVRKMLI